MGKIIKLTESDLVRIVKKVISEQERIPFEETLDNLYNQLQSMSTTVIKQNPSLRIKVGTTLNDLNDFIDTVKQFKANQKGKFVGTKLQQMLMTTFGQVPSLSYLFESLSKKFMNGDPGDGRKNEIVNQINDLINQLKNLPIKK